MMNQTTIKAIYTLGIEMIKRLGLLSFALLVVGLSQLSVGFDAVVWAEERSPTINNNKMENRSLALSLQNPTTPSSPESVGWAEVGSPAISSNVNLKAQARSRLYELNLYEKQALRQFERDLAWIEAHGNREEWQSRHQAALNSAQSSINKLRGDLQAGLTNNDSQQLTAAMQAVTTELAAKPQDLERNKQRWLSTGFDGKLRKLDLEADFVGLRKAQRQPTGSTNENRNVGLPTSAQPTSSQHQPTQSTKSDKNLNQLKAGVDDELSSIAASLNNNPVKLFNWMRENIAFVPSMGVIQGVEMTLHSKQGNAYDTALLFGALLDKANIDYRFGFGIVEIDAERFNAWLGVDQINAGLELLSQGGIVHEPIAKNGQYAAVQLEHVWVEAYVDMMPSRGMFNLEPDAWVALDTSFKVLSYQPGVDLVNLAGINGQAQANDVVAASNAGNDWIDLLDANALNSLLDNQVTILQNNITNQNLQDHTFAELLGFWQNNDPAYEPLPTTLPHRSVLYAGNSPSMPENVYHQYEYVLYTDKVAQSLDQSLLSYSGHLADIAHQYLRLQFVPASDADAQLLLSYLPEDPLLANLTDSIPGYLIQVIPQLWLGDELLASGQAMVFGSDLIAEVSHEHPNLGLQYNEHTVTAGEYWIIGSNPQGGLSSLLTNEVNQLETLADQLAQPNNLPNGDDLLRYQLSTQLYSFFAGADVYHAWQAGLLNVTQYRQPSFAGSSTYLQTEWVLGVPQQVRFAGSGLAVDRIWNQAVARDADDIIQLRYQRQAGQVSSTLGQLISNHGLEPSLGLSAIGLLANRLANNGKVYRINQNNVDQILPNLNLTPEEADRINALINAGKVISIEENQSNVGSWQGRGMVVVDPITGLGYYDIVGGKWNERIHHSLSIAEETKILGWTALWQDQLPWVLSQLQSDLVENQLSLGTGLGALAANPMNLGITESLLSFIASTLLTNEVTPYLTTMVGDHLWLGTVEPQVGLGSLLDPEPPQVNLQVNPLEIMLDEIIDVHVTATDNVGVVSLTATVSGNEIALDNNGDGQWLGNQVGEHEIKARARDAAGNVTTVTQTVLVKDPQDVSYPEVWIHSPEFNQVITESADVVISVTDDNLSSWELYFREVGNQSWNLLASGNQDVDEQAVTSIDPSLLLNGLYQLLLRGQDGNNQISEVMHPFSVEGERKVGHFSLTFEELTVPLGGIPITVTRTYDTRDKEVGDFGYGWRVGFNTFKIQENMTLGLDWEMYQIDAFNFCIEPLGGERLVSIRLPDGKLEQFSFGLTEPCAFGYPPTSGYPIFTPLSGTTSTLVAKYNPLLWWINGDWMDLDGYMDAFDPDEYYLITAEGMQYELDENFGVKSITTPDEELIQISQNGIIHSSGTAVSFARDTWGRITTITDPMGKTINYQYDDNDNLVASSNRNEETTTYTYDNYHYLLDIIAPNGVKAARNEYDDNGRLTAHIDALGNRIELTNDLDSNFQLIKDQRGYTTVYNYDNNGNVTSVTNALGETTNRTYDEHQNELTTTDPLGNTITRTFDNSRNPLTETDPLGNTTTMSYNDRNLLLVQKNALNQTVMTNSYMPKGQLYKTEDALGHSTQFGYQSGTLTSMTDAGNNKTQYSHNLKGWVTQETDAKGIKRAYTYDDNGNRLTETLYANNDALVTQYSYDNEGRLTQTVDPLGNTNSTQYNMNGQVAVQIDAKGNSTQYGYDAIGRQNQITFTDNLSQQTVYDKVGNPVKQIDELNRETITTYDAANRPLQITYPDNSIETSTYDAAGRLTQQTDANGNSIQYQYDKAGRQTKVIDANDKETSHTYNEIGQRKTTTDANNQVTSFDYDAKGQLTKVTYADNTVTSYTYDELGRKQTETNPLDQTTTYAYDAVGNLTQVDVNGLTVAYGYDEVGNKTQQTDKLNRSTTWEYDELNRPVSRTLPMNQSESMSYDAVGNLLNHTDFNNETTSHTYDNRNRLSKTTFDNNETIDYNYTATGNRQSVTFNNQTTTYTYNNRDRLTQVSYPNNQSINYGYDNVGNRTSITTQYGSVNYTYNKLNQLETVSDDNGTTTYGYDDKGNLQTVTYPNNLKTQYAYNSKDQLTDIDVYNDQDQLIQSYGYSLDDLGQIESITEWPSNRSVDYVYNDTNWLEQETIQDPDNGDQTISYQYDAVGNRIQKTQNGEITTYVYNNNDQLTTETTNNVVTNYSYDNNGSLINKSNPTVTIDYTYDVRNKLIQQSKTENNETVITNFTYDADGNRLSKTENGQTVYYLVDINQQYPQVIAEIDQNNNVLVNYTYGLDLISQSNGQDTNFYHTDHLGSTRSLSNPAGEITDSYGYESYGKLIYSNGTTENNYLFAGEQYDRSLDNYYLRARYYDPNIGRFTQMDGFPGFNTKPITLHKYAYGNLNPLMYADPSGRFGLPSISISINISSILSTAAIGAVVGGIFGAADAFFAEEDITKGAITGMLFGALLGPLTGIQALKPLLSGLAIGGAVYGVYDAGVERQDFGLAAFRGVTFVAGAKAIMLNARSIRTGNVSVYQSVDTPSGNVVYVGITKGFEARAAQHFKAKGIFIEKMPGLNTLSRPDARAVEQVLIEFYGLGKNGGTLINKINSIAKRNPIYAKAVDRGRAILKQSGFPGI